MVGVNIWLTVVYFPGSAFPSFFKIALQLTVVQCKLCCWSQNTWLKFSYSSYVWSLSYTATTTLPIIQRAWSCNPIHVYWKVSLIGFNENYGTSNYVSLGLQSKLNFTSAFHCNDCNTFNVCPITTNSPRQSEVWCHIINRSIF